MLEVQQIGRVEIFLRELEAQVLDGAGHDATLLVALSKYWTLGFYELLRRYRENVGKRSIEWDQFAALFQVLEDVRMPLAKEQLAKERNSFHVPEPIFLTEERCTGWNVFRRDKNDLWPTSRRSLADTFLAAALADPKDGA